MIGYVKKINIDPFTERNFHNIPVDTENYDMRGHVLGNPDVVLFKDSIINSFQSFIENHTRAHKAFANYTCYMQVSSNLYTIRVIVPFRAGGGMIEVVVGGLKYAMQFAIETPISIARNHILQYYKYMLSSRLRRWLDMELFKCACREINPFQYNWNRLADLTNIHD